MAKKPIIDQDQIELGKMCQMVIRNFRGIGRTPVVVDLDSIVVLVGPNNTGKSSILRAYEIAMLDGSKAGHLDKEDFPDGNIDSENLPTIELETEVIGNPPGKKWIIDVDGRKIVRERWVWEQPGPGKRQGWNVELADGPNWDETNVPWGYTAVANARRPQPHAVRAFDSPEDQAKQINSLVLTLVQERALSLPAADGSEVSEFVQLSQRLKEFQDRVVSHAKVDLEEIEGKLTAMIAQIFTDHVVGFEPTPSSFEGFKLFAGSKMLVGHKDGYRSPLELQGSGARRTILWSVLRIISESAKGQSRPHLLLIDEPELCLHPSAVREACRVLYDLADKAGWQVMVTTHHPAFIDLARDNKTIVRVERTTTGDINGTTLFKPSVAHLSDDDKKNLKLLNIFDPYVAEFFFGGRVIVVEGDTEYSAFKYVAQELLELGDKSPIPCDLLKSMHIVRARGKYTIVSLCKILNHFGTRYSVLHDGDTPRISVKDRKTGVGKEQANPAWAANQQILTEVESAPDKSRVRLLASKPNFERAFLGYDSGQDKPYAAVQRLKEDTDSKAKVIKLLLALIDHTKAPPGEAVPTQTLLSEAQADEVAEPQALVEMEAQVA